MSEAAFRMMLTGKQAEEFIRKVMGDDAFGGMRCSHTALIGLGPLTEVYFDRPEPWPEDNSLKCCVMLTFVSGSYYDYETEWTGKYRQTCKESFKEPRADKSIRHNQPRKRRAGQRKV